MQAADPRPCHRDVWAGTATNVKTPRSGTEKPRLWTVEDLAFYLGVPVHTVYKWRSTGEGPPGYRIGRHLRFDQAEVRRWLESRRSRA